MSNNLTKRHIVQKIYEQGDYKHDDVRDIVQKTLDIMQEAICDLTEMYNEELARFPGDAVLSKAKEISCK